MVKSQLVDDIMYGKSQIHVYSFYLQWRFFEGDLRLF